MVTLAPKFREVTREHPTAYKFAVAVLIGDFRPVSLRRNDRDNLAKLQGVD